MMSVLKSRSGVGDTRSWRFDGVPNASRDGGEPQINNLT
jgi:hypothetical protein